MKTGICRLVFVTFVTVLPLDLALATPGPKCETGSIKELEASIEDHNENIYRLHNKFENIWYLQGHVPEEVRKEISLGQIKDFLKRLEPPKSGRPLPRHDRT